MGDAEIIQDFLAESSENLDRLDRELVGLEKNPHDKDALASIFRTIHTIKGTCGFLGFNKLEKVAHVGENLLTRLRDGQLVLDPEITTALLAMVDAIRQMLSEIQSCGQDGNNDYPELREALTRLQNAGTSVAATGSSSPFSSPLPTENKPASVPDASAPDMKTVADPYSSSDLPVEAAAKRSRKRKASSPKAQPKPEEQALPTSPSTNGTVARQTTDAKPRETITETVRVAVNLLDKLMTLVGELVLARNQLLQFSNSVANNGLHVICQRLNLIATELQEEVMRTRMQPIGNIWNQFPRTVRDVAVSCGKQVTIEMKGKETELDKTIIEAIKDPLTHLVRNSVDHGIELPQDRVKAGKDPAGRLTLRAFHEGGQVNIEIRDDGAGLNRNRILKKAIDRKLITDEQQSRLSDREILNLIFLPGLSTAEKVTNVSGRGVGMDVVKTNVEKIGGVVDIQSIAGKGTTVRIKIPLTLAIIPALIVTCEDERFAIPQVNLLELVRLEGEQARAGVEMVHGVPVHRLRGSLLPLVYLNRELNLISKSGAERENTSRAKVDEAVNIVVLQADDRRFGLVVDEINDTEEIVVKPLRKQLKTVKVFAGSSIMGDGRVALILDVLGLAQHSRVISDARDRTLAEKTPESTAAAQEKQTFLLFAGLGDSRMAIPLSALDRLEEFPVSQIEMSGTQWVTQYRDQILPLIRLNLVLEERRQKLRAFQALPSSNSGPIPVLVFNHEGSSFGLIVERIIDIIEDCAVIKTPATRACVLYSVVIGERITELLDIPAIVSRAGHTVPQPVITAKSAGAAN
jgi:two-component system, chemotaxis family, sensor kinase CheA